MNEETKFDNWAVVEIMGRQVIAGRVTEAVIGGTSFIRVDVPEQDGHPAFTRFYGSGAIYALTPVSEEAARLVLKRNRPEPVTVYVPELRLPEPYHADPDWEDDDEDDDEDGDEDGYDR